VDFRVIDSHTGGEPTRTIVEGGPDLSRDPVSGQPLRSVAEKLECFRNHFDRFRRALVNEPRGSDVMVGAILVPADCAESQAGVIFFNNVGYLGMCGHGTLGVLETLRRWDSKWRVA
jgi:4-hydroxyproline epimerase